MTTENVLPEVEAIEATAGAGDQHIDAEPAEQDGQQEKAEKAEVDPREKELRKANRRINNIVSQREQARAEAAQLRAELEKLRNNAQNTGTVRNDSDDDADVLKIPRSALPKFKEQIRREAELERGIEELRVKMSEQLGDEFEEVTDYLARSLHFSEDLQFAVAASEAPAELARYLNDPDNAKEAMRIAQMPSYLAHRALVKIEEKLTARKNDKPQPSKAATPLQPARASASTSNNGMPDPKDTKAWVAWANAQERKR